MAVLVAAANDKSKAIAGNVPAAVVLSAPSCDNITDADGNAGKMDLSRRRLLRSADFVCQRCPRSVSKRAPSRKK